MAEISLLQKQSRAGHLPLEKQGNKSEDGKAAAQARETAFFKKRAAGQIEISYGSNSQASY